MTFGDPGAYLHLGVVPVRHGVSQFDWHTSTTDEYEFVVNEVTGFVSGSWGCWGTADQETEGDNTLHLVLDVTRPYTTLPDAMLAEFHRQLITQFAARIPTHTRLTDHGLVSTQDWSELIAVVTIDSLYRCNMLQLGRLGRQIF